MKNSIQLTDGARWLKRGDTFDPECHRRTYRLHLARAILRAQGIEPTTEHCKNCSKHPVNIRCGMRPGHCWDKCLVTWGPEWVTDAMFQHAWDLANEIQTERGAYNQRAASQSAEEARKKRVTA